MDTPVLELDNVSYRYNGEPALDHVSFSLGRGEILGLIGPNGAGKSTLLRLIVRLLSMQEGTLRLFGHDVRRFRQWARVGYVGQRVWNFDQRFPANVEEIASTGRIASRGFLKLLGTADRQATQRALQLVGMWDFRKQIIGELSGGQQQRVFLARALASEPELLLLDEPTTAVDTETQASFFALLRQLNREHGLTIVLVSHDLPTVSAHATTIAHINRRLVSFGPPAAAPSSQSGSYELKAQVN